MNDITALLYVLVFIFINCEREKLFQSDLINKHNILFDIYYKK